MSGPSGLEFVHAALREGYTLTLYLRNAAKLPTEIKDNALVTFIEGELNNEVDLEKAASSGVQSVVSFIGPVIGGPRDVPVGSKRMQSAWCLSVLTVGCSPSSQDTKSWFPN